MDEMHWLERITHAVFGHYWTYWWYTLGKDYEKRECMLCGLEQRRKWVEREPRIEWVDEA